MDRETRLGTLSEKAQRAAWRGDYERAIELVEEFLEIRGTDERWGLSFIQTQLQRLRQQESDPALVAAFHEQERAITEKLLGLDEEGEAWLHRWERARQLNGRAWEAYEEHRGGRGQDARAGLRKALEDARGANRFWPYFLPHVDTLIRILLALDETDEAYRQARWVENIQPDWPDFVDIWSKKAYRSWIREHASEPIALPAGRATLGPVAPTARAPHSPAGARPLTEFERELLKQVRLGADEWHRARNAALVATVLDVDLRAEVLVDLLPQRVDLSFGTCKPGIGELSPYPIPAVTLDKLRHWMLYGFTNHADTQQGKPWPAGEARLFMDYDLNPLDLAQMRRIVAEAGEAVGISGLTLERCATPPEER